MFIRRDRRGFHRFTWWRVGLFFLAAGIWIGGVVAANEIATGVAIVVLFVAVVLGLVGRDREEKG